MFLYPAAAIASENASFKRRTRERSTSWKRSNIGGITPSCRAPSSTCVISIVSPGPTSVRTDTCPFSFTKKNPSLHCATAYSSSASAGDHSPVTGACLGVGEGVLNASVSEDARKDQWSDGRRLRFHDELPN